MEIYPRESRLVYPIFLNILKCFISTFLIGFVIGLSHLGKDEVFTDAVFLKFFLWRNILWKPSPTFWVCIQLLLNYINMFRICIEKYCKLETEIKSVVIFKKKQPPNEDWRHIFKRNKHYTEQLKCKSHWSLFIKIYSWQSSTLRNDHTKHTSTHMLFEILSVSCYIRKFDESLFLKLCAFILNLNWLKILRVGSNIWWKLSFSPLYHPCKIYHEHWWIWSSTTSPIFIHWQTVIIFVLVTHFDFADSTFYLLVQNIITVP